MLPPFILTATLDGEYVEFVACDVPTGVFLGADFQEVMPGMACYSAESAEAQRAMLARMEAWSDAMLTRVIADPVLSRDDVLRLGSARDELVVGYLWGIGWETPADALKRVSPRIAEGPFAAPAPSLEALRAIPSENMKKAVRELAAKARTDPDAVLATWPVSKFIRNWRMIMQDDLLKSARGGLGQSDLMDIVGREAA
jgi:hypothetical protein